MQNCISTISIISTYRRAAALLDGSGKRVYFLREKGAFFFTGKTLEQPEQNRQQEAGRPARTTTPGNRPRISAPLQGRKGKARKRRPPVVYKCAVTTRRRNIPNNADGSRGTGRRISRTRKAKEPRKNPERKKAAGQPLPICCNSGKDETAAAGSAGQDQRHREPPAGRKVQRYFRKKKRGCGAVSAIFFRKKTKYFLPFRYGDIIGGGVYMTPCPPAAPAAALCNPPAGSGETRRGKIRPCPTKTLFSFSGTCWGAVPKPGGLSAGNARLYIHAPSLPKRKQRFFNRTNRTP